MNGSCESVMLAHEDQEAEWWYVSGNVATVVGPYAFHLAFFRHRTARVRAGGFLPVRWFGEQLHFAHFAVTECDGGRFHFEHRRAIRPAADAPRSTFQVSHGDWSLSATPQGVCLSAAVRGVRFELELRTRKPLLRLRPTAPGSETPAYESCTRLLAVGHVLRGDQAHEAMGEGWLEHECGRLGMHQDRQGWDWFGLQLEDGWEFVFYGLREHGGAWNPQAFAALIEPDGDVLAVPMDQVELTPLSWTRSPHTGIVYPVEWRLRVGTLDVELRIAARMKCHELDTRGSTCVVYWEGPVACAGHRRGVPVSGRGFVELTGRDHLADRLGIFDFGRGGLGLAEGFANEARFLLHRKGVTRTDSRWPTFDSLPSSPACRQNWGEIGVAPPMPPC